MLQSSLYCSSEDWVFSYDGHYWYESDFYRFFPKHEWKGIVGAVSYTHLTLPTKA